MRRDGRVVLWNRYNRVCRFVQRVADGACRKAVYQEARELLQAVDWQRGAALSNERDEFNKFVAREVAACRLTHPPTHVLALMEKAWLERARVAHGHDGPCEDIGCAQ